MGFSIRTLSLLIFGFTTTALAQSEPEMMVITRDWQINDERIVQTTTLVKTSVDGNLLQNIEIAAEYSIKVIDTSGQFLLEYRQVSDDMSIDLKSFFPDGDSISAFVLALIDKMTEGTKETRFMIYVDKETGMATGIKNKAEYLTLIQNSTESFVGQYGREKGKDETEIKAMSQKALSLVALWEEKILEGMLNNINLILQIYSVEFAVNSTVSYDLLVYDVNTLGQFADIEFPAIYTVTSVEHPNHTLDVTSDLDYDKSFFLDVLKKQNPNTDLEEDDLNIVEKTDYTFDLETGWVMSYSENVYIRMGTVETTSKTKILFRKP